MRSVSNAQMLAATACGQDRERNDDEGQERRIDVAEVVPDRVDVLVGRVARRRTASPALRKIPRSGGMTQPARAHNAGRSTDARRPSPPGRSRRRRPRTRARSGRYDRSGAARADTSRGWRRLSDDAHRTSTLDLVRALAVVLASTLADRRRGGLRFHLCRHGASDHVLGRLCERLVQRDLDAALRPRTRDAGPPCARMHTARGGWARSSSHHSRATPSAPRSTAGHRKRESSAWSTASTCGRLSPGRTAARSAAGSASRPGSCLRAASRANDQPRYHRRP